MDLPGSSSRKVSGDQSELLGRRGSSSSLNPPRKASSASEARSRTSTPSSSVDKDAARKDSSRPGPSTDVPETSGNRVYLLDPNSMKPTKSLFEVAKEEMAKDSKSDIKLPTTKEQYYDLEEILMNPARMEGRELTLNAYDAVRAKYTVFPDNKIAEADMQKVIGSFSCDVCQELIQGSIMTKKCGHRFCDQCILVALMRSGNTCPTCRQNLGSKRELQQDPRFDQLIYQVVESRSIVHRMLQSNREHERDVYFGRRGYIDGADKDRLNNGDGDDSKDKMKEIPPSSKLRIRWFHEEKEDGVVPEVVDSAEIEKVNGEQERRKKREGEVIVIGDDDGKGVELVVSESDPTALSSAVEKTLEDVNKDTLKDDKTTEQVQGDGDKLGEQVAETITSDNNDKSKDITKDVSEDKGGEVMIVGEVSNTDKTNPEQSKLLKKKPVAKRKRDFESSSESDLGDEDEEESDLEENEKDSSDESDSDNSRRDSKLKMRRKSKSDKKNDDGTNRSGESDESEESVDGSESGRKIRSKKKRAPESFSEDSDESSEDSDSEQKAGTNEKKSSSSTKKKQTGRPKKTKNVSENEELSDIPTPSEDSLTSSSEESGKEDEDVYGFVFSEEFNRDPRRDGHPEKDKLYNFDFMIDMDCDMVRKHEEDGVPVVISDDSNSEYDTDDSETGRKHATSAPKHQNAIKKYLNKQKRSQSVETNDSGDKIEVISKSEDKQPTEEAPVVPTENKESSPTASASEPAAAEKVETSTEAVSDKEEEKMDVDGESEVDDEEDDEEEEELSPQLKMDQKTVMYLDGAETERMYQGFLFREGDTEADRPKVERAPFLSSSGPLNICPQKVFLLYQSGQGLHKIKDVKVPGVINKAARKKTAFKTAVSTAAKAKKPIEVIQIDDESTIKPTAKPTGEPTTKSTAEPTTDSTAEPRVGPSTEPTIEPTIESTTKSTFEPTAEPTAEPTIESTAEPTIEPTAEPTTSTQEKSDGAPTTESPDVVCLDPPPVIDISSDEESVVSVSSEDDVEFDDLCNRPLKRKLFATKVAQSLENKVFYDTDKSALPIMKDRALTKEASTLSDETIDRIQERQLAYEEGKQHRRRAAIFDAVESASKTLGINLDSSEDESDEEESEEVEESSTKNDKSTVSGKHSSRASSVQLVQMPEIEETPIEDMFFDPDEPCSSAQAARRDAVMERVEREQQLIEDSILRAKQSTLPVEDNQVETIIDHDDMHISDTEETINEGTKKIEIKKKVKVPAQKNVSDDEDFDNLYGSFLKSVDAKLLVPTITDYVTNEFVKAVADQAPNITDETLILNFCARDTAKEFETIRKTGNLPTVNSDDEKLENLVKQFNQDYTARNGPRKMTRPIVNVERMIIEKAHAAKFKHLVEVDPMHLQILIALQKQQLTVARANTSNPYTISPEEHAEQVGLLQHLQNPAILRQLIVNPQFAATLHQAQLQAMQQQQAAQKAQQKAAADKELAVRRAEQMRVEELARKRIAQEDAEKAAREAPAVVPTTTSGNSDSEKDKVAEPVQVGAAEPGVNVGEQVEQQVEKLPSEEVANSATPMESETATNCGAMDTDTQALPVSTSTVPLKPSLFSPIVANSVKRPSRPRSANVLTSTPRLPRTRIGSECWHERRRQGIWKRNNSRSRSPHDRNAIEELNEEDESAQAGNVTEYFDTTIPDEDNVFGMRSDVPTREDGAETSVEDLDEWDVDGELVATHYSEKTIELDESQQTFLSTYSEYHQAIEDMREDETNREILQYANRYHPKVMMAASQLAEQKRKNVEPLLVPNEEPTEEAGAAEPQDQAEGDAEEQEVDPTVEEMEKVINKEEEELRQKSEQLELAKKVLRQRQGLESSDSESETESEHEAEEAESDGTETKKAVSRSKAKPFVPQIPFKIRRKYVERKHEMERAKYRARVKAQKMSTIRITVPPPRPKFVAPQPPTRTPKQPAAPRATPKSKKSKMGNVNAPTKITAVPNLAAGYAHHPQKMYNEMAHPQQNVRANSVAPQRGPTPMQHQGPSHLAQLGQFVHGTTQAGQPMNEAQIAHIKMMQAAQAAQAAHAAQSAQAAYAAQAAQAAQAGRAGNAPQQAPPNTQMGPQHPQMGLQNPQMGPQHAQPSNAQLTGQPAPQPGQPGPHMQPPNPQQLHPAQAQMMEERRKMDEMNSIYHLMHSRGQFPPTNQEAFTIHFAQAQAEIRNAHVQNQMAQAMKVQAEALARQKMLQAQEQARAQAAAAAKEAARKKAQAEAAARAKAEAEAKLKAEQERARQAQEQARARAELEAKQKAAAAAAAAAAQQVAQALPPGLTLQQLQQIQYQQQIQQYQMQQFQQMQMQQIQQMQMQQAFAARMQQGTPKPGGAQGAQGAPQPPSMPNVPPGVPGFPGMPGMLPPGMQMLAGMPGLGGMPIQGLPPAPTPNPAAQQQQPTQPTPQQLLAQLQLQQHQQLLQQQLLGQQVPNPYTQQVPNPFAQPAGQPRATPAPTPAAATQPTSQTPMPQQMVPVPAQTPHAVPQGVVAVPPAAVDPQVHLQQPTTATEVIQPVRPASAAQERTNGEVELELWPTNGYTEKKRQQGTTTNPAMYLASRGDSTFYHVASLVRSRSTCNASDVGSMWVLRLEDQHVMQFQLQQTLAEAQKFVGKQHLIIFYDDVLAGEVAQSKEYIVHKDFKPNAN